MTQPAPTIPDGLQKFGPGTFTVGADASLKAASCLINSINLEPSVDVPDPTRKLCGITRQGEPEYTWEISGNMDSDAGSDSGFFALCWTGRGTEVPFRYRPAADGATVTGTLRLDPLPYGGDEYGTDLTADFTLTVIGEPEFTWEP